MDKLITNPLVRSSSISLPKWPFWCAYLACFVFALVLLSANVKPLNVTAVALGVLVLFMACCFITLPFVLEYLSASDRRLRAYRRRLEELHFRMHAMEITLSAEFLPEDSGVALDRALDSVEVEEGVARRVDKSQRELPFMPQPREFSDTSAGATRAPVVGRTGGVVGGSGSARASMLSRALGQREKDSPAKAVSALIERGSRRSHPDAEPVSPVATEADTEGLPAAG